MSGKYILDYEKLIFNEEDARYGLIILNRPLKVNSQVYESLWKRASFRLLVDGGGNRWYDKLKANSSVVQNGLIIDPLWVPDLLSGDLDSVRPDVLDICRQNGVTIVPTMDQNETDFTKALLVISEKKDIQFSQVSCIVTLTEHSGRIDQTLSTINTLFKAEHIFPIPVFLLSSDSVSVLLRPGFNELWVPSRFRHSWCSLVPMGSPAKNVTTTGLKWNLTNQCLLFGGMVSTSNEFSSPSSDEPVTVQCDSHLLWSFAFPPTNGPS